MDHFPSTHHSAGFDIRVIAKESVLMSTPTGLMASYQFHVSIYCLGVLKFLFRRDLKSVLRKSPFKSMVVLTHTHLFGLLLYFLLTKIFFV